MVVILFAHPFNTAQKWLMKNLSRKSFIEAATCKRYDPEGRKLQALRETKNTWNFVVIADCSTECLFTGAACVKYFFCSLQWVEKVTAQMILSSSPLVKFWHGSLFVTRTVACTIARPFAHAVHLAEKYRLKMAGQQQHLLFLSGPWSMIFWRKRPERKDVFPFGTRSLRPVDRGRPQCPVSYPVNNSVIIWRRANRRMNSCFWFFVLNGPRWRQGVLCCWHGNSTTVQGYGGWRKLIHVLGLTPSNVHLRGPVHLNCTLQFSVPGVKSKSSLMAQHGDEREYPVHLMSYKRYHQQREHTLIANQQLRIAEWRQNKMATMSRPVESNMYVIVALDRCAKPGWVPVENAVFCCYVACYQAFQGPRRQKERCSFRLAPRST